MDGREGEGEGEDEGEGQGEGEVEKEGSDGKKLLIEDAHVNLDNVLNNFGLVSIISSIAKKSSLGIE